MPALPLSTADILHENTGMASDASSVNVALAGAEQTDGGATLLVMIHHGGAISTPAGFTLDYGVGTDTLGRVSFFRKSSVAAESSWTFSTVTGTTPWQWTVLEVARLAASPLHKNNNATYTGTDATIDAASSGITRNDCLLLGGFTLRTSVSQASLSSLTIARNEGANMARWSLIADQRWSTDGSVNHLANPFRFFTYPYGGTITARATLGGNSALTSDSWLTAVVAYASADAGRVEPLEFADGFEYGITPNTASPLTSRQMVNILNGTWGTQVAVSSSAARNGSYGLRVNQTGQAGRLGWDTNTLGTTKDASVCGFNARVNSGSGVVVVAEITPAAGDPLQLVYDVTNTQFGLRWGSGGTIASQTATTALGAWVWVDLSAVGLNATTRTARWAITEGGVSVEQTPPADLTGQTAGGLVSVTFGLNAAQTMQADYDDVCLSTDQGDYRLGQHKVLLLGPDPAGTPTVTGAGGTAAFNTFSNNGTLAAWNATTVRGVLGEVPLDISTTADGLVQITTQTTTWASIPMDTYTLAAGERITYVGAVFALWANAGQNATLQLNGSGAGTGPANWLNTGTAFSPGNAAQPPSATVPTWVRGKRDNTFGWTQASLNALELEIGRSSDAAPDIGVHCGYLQVAVMLGAALPLFGAAGAALRVETDTDQLSGAVAKLYAYTPAGQSATLRYEVGGTQHETNVPAGSNPLTVTVAADDVQAISRIELTPA